MPNHLEHLFAGYPPILSAKDLAEVLGLNSKTVYEYLQSGELPAYHVGSKWVIVRDEVIEHISRTSNVTERKPTGLAAAAI
ncbi:helix-turn-helix domain-containing protein [Microbacterium testaceum]|uniref:helix-turn-helix domain-containing protein n=1 Tax=Microbacterium testaceum TaxID=2033 RepID=UPI0024360BF8|nr:helix-turn-helix domain-containing protein [Microbacterium testaceum]